LTDTTITPEIGQPSAALEQSRQINIESLLKDSDIDSIANILLEDTFRETDLMRKDSIDRFLDFAIFKAQTGLPHILNMAYPTKRMSDSKMEDKIRILINDSLYPEIVLKLLKYFTRNTHDPDSNLYLANFIVSDDIIRAIYETYVLFKKDIFHTDPDTRSMNVKRIQQVSLQSDNKSASPLDAACRLKYILEFFAIKKNVEHIYTRADLLLAPGAS